MEISSVKWLSEMGMEDASLFQQCDMNSLDHFTTQQIAAALGQDFHNSNLSSESYTNSFPCITQRSSTAFSCSSMETQPTVSERPTKQLKTSDHWASPPDSSSPNLLSFANQNSSYNNQHFFGNIITGAMKPKDESISPTTSNLQSDLLISQGGSFMDPSYGGEAAPGQKRGSPLSGKPPHTQDHIIAERKRREKLSQRFIALSAIVPGLKKMDKASVLGDAIKYVKQLQERVKVLEDQTEKKTMESVVFVRKSVVSMEDDSSSTDENFEGRQDEPLPEIEARVSDKHVLIRVHCEKRKGVLVKTLAEIEQLHLCVNSTSVIPFANSALDITVVAQMEEEFSMTMKDLVRRLRTACTQYFM